VPHERKQRRDHETRPREDDAERELQPKQGGQLRVDRRLLLLHQRCTEPRVGHEAKERQRELKDPEDAEIARLEPACEVHVGDEDDHVLEHGPRAQREHAQLRVTLESWRRHGLGHGSQPCTDGAGADRKSARLLRGR
jgi:hypothetical protein